MPSTITPREEQQNTTASATSSGSPWMRVFLPRASRHETERLTGKTDSAIK
jgi:hypothetical protein